MQYMEKVVENERTGANISGIRVETQTSALLNRPDLQGLAELERIAKEADQVNLKNKQQKFMLDLEAMDLEFQEKWNGPLIYNDQEKYETMLSEKKALESEKAALVQQNQFFSLGEKDILRQQLSNRHTEIVLDHQKKRNTVVLRQAIDDSQANLDQYVTLSSKVNIHDYNRINEYNEQIVENIKSLQVLTGMSDEEVINAAAFRIQQATNARYQTYLNDMILSGDLPLQEQERRVNELETVMNDEKYKRSVAKELASKLPTDDKKEAEDYFYAKLDTETKSIVGGIKRQFGEIKKTREREERRAAVEAKRQAKERERYARRIQELQNPELASDVNKAFKKKYKRDITMKDIQANLIDLDWQSAGDFSNGKSIKIFPTKLLKDIQGVVEEEIKNGSSVAEAKNTVKAKAIEYFPNDINKQKAFIKQYADTVGESANAYFNGDINPALYKADSYKQNGVKNGIPEVDVSSIKPTDKKSLKRFNDISKKLSKDPVRGDEMAKRLMFGAGKDMGYSKEEMIHSVLAKEQVLEALSSRTGLVNAYKDVTTNQTQIQSVTTSLGQKEKVNAKTSIRSKISRR